MLEHGDKSNLDIFTGLAHHASLYVIVAAQNIYSDGRIFRQLVRQAQYLTILNSPRLTSSLRTLSMQIFGDAKFLMSVVQDLKQFTPLLLDLDGRTQNSLRVRTLTHEIEKIRVYQPSQKA